MEWDGRQFSNLAEAESDGMETPEKAYEAAGLRRKKCV